MPKYSNLTSGMKRGENRHGKGTRPQSYLPKYLNHSLSLPVYTEFQSSFQKSVHRGQYRIGFEKLDMLPYKIS